MKGNSIRVFNMYGSFNIFLNHWDKYILINILYIHLLWAFRMCWPRNFELQGVALKHSPLQLMFSVLGFKNEYEQKHGPIKSEALAKRYEDSIIWANPEEAATWLQIDLLK